MEENFGGETERRHLSAGINTLDLAENGGRKLNKRQLLSRFHSCHQSSGWSSHFCQRPVMTVIIVIETIRRLQSIPAAVKWAQSGSGEDRVAG